MNNSIKGGRTTSTSNFYDVLGITPSSTLVDIERAYQKLLKESRYNTAISRKEVETAYKILHDPTSKAVYDASLAEYKKRLETTARHKVKKEKTLTTGKMLAVLGVLVVIASIFLVYRYGHLLKSFEVGDSVYYKDSHKMLGKVLEVSNEHDFGSVSLPGYLIEMRDDGQKIWIPQYDVKAICYKR